MKTWRSKIAGTGSAFPARSLSNFDLEKMVDTDHAWILERTGIAARRISCGEAHETTSALSIAASKKAIEASQLAVNEIDLVLLATITPDFVMPNTACLVQEGLGMTKAGAIDISAACSGFVYGLCIADSLIQTGQFKNILLIGAEVLSSIVNWKDRNTCILFGDGAGAAVISRADPIEKSQLLGHCLYADGRLKDLLTVPSSGVAAPVTHETIDAGLTKVQMKGKEIFKVAVKTLADCMVEVLESKGLKVNDLDWLIPHQANARILEAVAKRLDFPLQKVIQNIEQYGNTSGATVPTALDEGIRSQRIQRGDLVGLTVFGAGLTCGASLLRY